MSDEVLLTVTNLSKSYVLATDRTDSFRAYLYSLAKHLFRPDSRPKETEFCALDGVSFTVKRGDAIGILGSNGAGKSTLLKIISGITSPGSGQFALHGKVRSVLEVGTGFHPDLNARDNVLLNGALLGMKRSEILRQVDEIIAFSGIGDYAQQPVKHYSSGMYVRLAFSVAAFLKSDILLLDEVLSVGDAAFRRKAMNKIKDLLREGTAVLFVTHNLGEILDLCNQCIWMEHGRIRSMGNSVELVKDYLESSLYNESENTDNLSHRINLAATPITFDPIDPSSPIHIHQVMVKNSHSTNIHEIVKEESIEISIGVSVNLEQPTTPLDVGYKLNDIYGNCLLLTKTTLNGQGGSYYVKSTIPGHILNTGTYFISIGVFDTMSGIPRILSPSVYFKIVSLKSEFAFAVEGCLSPNVDWVIEKK
jgi:ABC-type polysaccharide/polyol phosphate transport system ATPase subunit